MTQRSHLCRSASWTVTALATATGGGGRGGGLLAAQSRGGGEMLDQLDSISDTSLCFPSVPRALPFHIARATIPVVAKSQAAFSVTDFGLHYSVTDLAVARYWQ